MSKNTPFPTVFMRRYLALLLSGVLTFSLQAQEASKSHYPTIDSPALHLGGIAGGVYSQMYFAPSVSQSPHFGATMGISAQLENGKYMGMHAELLYTLRGWTEKFTPAGSLAPLPHYSRYLHYIELPLMASFHYPIGNFRIGIKIGPQIGYLLASRINASTEGFTEVQTQRHNMPLIGKFAWGITSGPSISYSFGKHRIELETRFYMGFNDLISTTLADKYSRAGEMVGMVTLAYFFQVL